MKILYFKTGPISVNTYIVYNEKSLDGFIIDPGGNYKRIKKECSDYGIKLKAQLLTHGHFDHCGACAELQKEGIPVYIHKDDMEKLNNSYNLAGMFNISFNSFTAEKILNEGDKFTIAEINIEVLHTPGHTSGSVCYIIENNIFSGDTIFKMSIGRTDFPGGDTKTLHKSIRDKIFKLKGDYNLYPGHDEFTTLDYERSNNPMFEENSIHHFEMDD